MTASASLTMYPLKPHSERVMSVRSFLLAQAGMPLILQCSERKSISYRELHHTTMIKTPVVTAHQTVRSSVDAHLELWEERHSPIPRVDLYTKRDFKSSNTHPALMLP